MRERVKPSLLETISLTWAYYNQGQSLSDSVLLMYESDLADLDPIACIDAYERWRRNPANKKNPLPAEIREMVNPEEFVAVETQAREIASRIMGAIPKFGWANPKEAQAYIGPHGWALVDRAGGWRYLCENTQARQVPTMLAQFRDQLEGTLRYSLPVVERTIAALPSAEARGLESVREIAARLQIATADRGPGDDRWPGTQGQGPEGEGA